MLIVLRPVALLLLGTAILILGNGLLGILLPIRMADIDLTAARFVQIAYYVGQVIGCLYARRIIAAVGHVRAFSIFTAVIAASALLHSLWVTAAIWLALRCIAGFCMAGLFNVIESWLSYKSTNEMRGQVFSAYTVVTSIAWGTGQFLVNAGDAGGFELFVLAALLITLSFLPIALTRVARPQIGEFERFSFAELYRISPLGVVGAFTGGLMGAGFFGMAAIFGKEAGFTTLEISLFVGVAVFGGLALQWPIGRLSDRFDRRQVLFCILIGLAVVCLLQFGVWQAWQAALPLIVMNAVFGGLQSMIYAISAAHALDHVDKHRTVGASGGLLLAWAIGAAVGPTLATLAMETWGGPALFVYLAAIAAILAGFTRYRMSRRTAPPADMPAPIAPMVGATTAGAALTPRPEPEADIDPPNRSS